MRALLAMCASLKPSPRIHLSIVLRFFFKIRQKNIINIWYARKTKNTDIAYRQDALLKNSALLSVLFLLTSISY
jgi:hypothetical protein